MPTLPNHVRQRKRSDGSTWFDYRRQLHKQDWKPSFGNDLGEDPQEMRRLVKLADAEFAKAKQASKLIVKATRYTFQNFALDRWIPEYVALHRGKRSAKRKLQEAQTTEQRLRDYVFPVIGGTWIHLVSDLHLDDLRDSVHKLKCSSDWKRKIMLDVSMCLDYARRKRVIAHNPYSKDMGFKVRRGLPRPLFPSELVRILEPGILRPVFRECIEVALHTGMRWGELRGLKKTSLDLGRRTLHLEDTKDPELPKWRVIPLDDRAFEICEAWNQTTLGEHLSPWRPASPNTPRRLTAKELGLRWEWGQLRHSFACFYLARNGDIYILSRLLGHSNVRTTEIYARVFDARMLEDFKRVNQIPLSLLPGGKLAQNLAHAPALELVQSAK